MEFLTQPIAFLSQASTEPAVWLSQVFAVVLLTVSCNYVLMRLLDIVKTRLQVLSGPQGGASGVPGVRHTFWSTAAELYRQHGASGFFRGVKPRMMSVSIWGTTMVTTYEFLKRTSKMDT